MERQTPSGDYGLSAVEALNHIAWLNLTVAFGACVLVFFAFGMVDSPRYGEKQFNLLALVLASLYDWRAGGEER